jgi:rare lipoprotein A
MGVAAGRYLNRLALGLLVAATASASAGCGGPARPVQAPAPAGHGRTVQLGVATYYSSTLAGHRTASGERYDPDALTAAHLTLPMGSVVRVTRIDGAGATLGGPVVVRINDRGPYAPGRILDLSLAAARRLGMLKTGVARIRLEVLSRP